MRMYLHPASRGLRLSLEGKLAGDSVGELERCCRALTSLDPGATLLIDVRALESADENGYRLLDTMRRIMSAWGRIVSCWPIFNRPFRSLHFGPSRPIENRPAGYNPAPRVNLPALSFDRADHD